jgi:predicted aspartyl protease
MKRYLSRQVLPVFLAIAGIISSTSISHSQSDLPCYLEDSNGNVIDLSHLCGSGSSTPSVIQVPIKRRLSGIPVVDVQFNGNRRFEMLFDTGASGIAITPPMAQVLNVAPEGIVITSTAGGKVEVPRGRVNSVAVGGIEVTNPEVTINQYLDIGLLGQGFFGVYDVTIKENVIELRYR